MKVPYFFELFNHLSNNYFETLLKKSGMQRNNFYSLSIKNVCVNSSEKNGTVVEKVNDLQYANYSSTLHASLRMYQITVAKVVKKVDRMKVVRYGYIYLMFHVV